MRRMIGYGINLDWGFGRVILFGRREIYWVWNVFRIRSRGRYLKVVGNMDLELRKSIFWDVKFGVISIEMIVCILVVDEIFRCDIYYKVV